MHPAVSRGTEVESALSIAAVLTGAFAAWILIGAAGPIRQTTLSTAWSWAVTCGLLGPAMLACDSLFSLLSRPWAEILWYITAIVDLCPAVAVLGARRPVDRVWNLFVLLPLIAVLGWPALTVLMHDSGPRLLQLQTPPLIAYGLVLVMSYGNYVGARYGWCVLLAATGQTLLLAPLAGGFLTETPERGMLRPMGVFCISAGVILARRLYVARHPPPAGLDRVWCDFRDWFGVVWARRVQERFEQHAQQQRLPVRLTSRGCAWEGPSANRAHDVAESERIMRWLLRRFVSDEWIDARMVRDASEAVR